MEGLTNDCLFLKYEYRKRMRFSIEQPGTCCLKSQYYRQNSESGGTSKYKYAEAQAYLSLAMKIGFDKFVLGCERCEKVPIPDT